MSKALVYSILSIFVGITWTSVIDTLLYSHLKGASLFVAWTNRQTASFAPENILNPLPCVLLGIVIYFWGRNKSNLWLLVMWLFGIVSGSILLMLFEISFWTELYSLDHQGGAASAFGWLFAWTGSFWLLGFGLLVGNWVASKIDQGEQ